MVDSRILKSKYIPTAEFYSQVIDSLEDYSIFTLDTEFRINSWNSGSTKLFQYETDEVIGKNFDMLFTEEDKKNGIPKIETDTALKEGKAMDNRWHVRKDKSKFYAYGLVFPLTGIEREMLGYVKILRDLTEQKKAEDTIKNYIKELEALNDHKDNILAILSHDLRSPLAGIIGTVEYLLSHSKSMDKSEIKQLLELLHKSSKDELNMLDYLVEWAKIKYASEAYSPKKLNLLKYVMKVIEMLKETAATNTIHIYYEIDENEEVFADEKMLLSIFQNIVSNAIKHSYPGGQIIITANKEEDDMVLVEIKDSGAGMSNDIRNKLFTPHIRNLSNANENSKGGGIGLLLVKGFLEKIGGDIWVKSTKGVGSSFYFTLPVNDPVQKTEKAKKLVLAERD